MIVEGWRIGLEMGIRFLKEGEELVGRQFLYLKLNLLEIQTVKERGWKLKIIGRSGKQRREEGHDEFPESLIDGCFWEGQLILEWLLHLRFNFWIGEHVWCDLNQMIDRLREIRWVRGMAIIVFFTLADAPALTYFFHELQHLLFISWWWEHRAGLFLRAIRNIEPLNKF